MTAPLLSIFPATLQSTSHHKIPVHNLLHKQPPLQSRICNRPSLPPKWQQIFSVPIYLSCYFFVKTHHKSSLQPKLGILTSLQDPYLSTTSNVNLSPTQPCNIKMLFKRNSSSCSSRLGFLQYEIGASLINMSSKPLLKVHKLTIGLL